MEQIAGCPIITPKEQLLANECQIRMKVVTKADLAELNGREIHIERLQGKWQATPATEFT